MNKYISIMAAACCLFLSCERESLVEVEEATPSPITGQVEQMAPETKVYLNENHAILWSAGDEVIVFNGTTLGKRYRVSAESAGKSSVNFDLIESLNPSGFSGGTEITNNVAYYPFNSAIQCTPGSSSSESSSYILSDLALPSAQTYVQNSFGPESNPMIAVTESVTDTDLLFRNVNGGIRLSLKGSGKISRIELQGNNGELIAGDADINGFKGLVPVVSMHDGASTKITLNCGGTGVQLNEQENTDFYISIPPTVFSRGISVNIYDADGGYMDLTTSTSFEVHRSVITYMPEATYVAKILTDLSANGTANSYIVSEAGVYKFRTVQGNSDTSVGEVSSVEVLWETFGTDTAPAVGDLVKNVSYADGYITFDATDKKGNASIAAKDATGKILWSWHIWLTDQPVDQVYYNNAGTMMDRNLGATSATPGDVGALGLLYQWGRKDPFLGGSKICYDSDENQQKAASTITWPESVISDGTTGTFAYAQENPTIFIKYNTSNYDWYYTGSSLTDNTRWRSSKTIYDPCPPGYRVPKGGPYGIWSKALGSSSNFKDQSLYNSTTRGFNLSGKLGDASIIWYPIPGYYHYSLGQLRGVGGYGGCWSFTHYGYASYSMYLDNNGNGVSSNHDFRALGQSVRCCKEEPSMPTHVDGDLNVDGKTANSYIVSKAGMYKFKTVQGNSTTSVGEVSSVEVLWETFGTATAPAAGDLVKNVSYADGYISFEATDKKGNASIAARGASGKILWSWHIWLTDQPSDQEYYSNAGTMMDRNLGATSASPGDVGALGLLYQWGRKDPFLGGSAISYSSSANQAKAASTLTWPEAVISDATIGTIAYAQEHPTTFIISNNKNYDWYYTGTSSTNNNTLWQSSKTIYDPCPPGYRVPDGGSNGVWSKALGSSSSFTDQTLYSSTTRGFNLSGKFGDASTIWYPLSGYLGNGSGQLGNVGSRGSYWSITPNSSLAYYLHLTLIGNVNPSYDANRPYGLSVRCLQE